MTNLVEKMQETVGDLVYFANAFQYAQEKYLKECDKPTGEYDYQKANESFQQAKGWCKMAINTCEALGFDTNKVLRDCVRFQEAYKSNFAK